MRIQRQCRALADALTDAVRNYMQARIEFYQQKSGATKPYKTPDSEIYTDEKDNTILIDGSLSGDLSNTRMCLVGEGVDVSIGEGSVVIGCIFSRLILGSATDSENKEVHVRHTIEIGKNCILIGALIRDDCTIQEGCVIAASAISEANIGAQARIFMSSVLLRYGTVGERFTAVQTIFHADKCEVGADAFMMSGKWGIIPWDTAIQSLDKELTERCCWIVHHNAILSILNESFSSGVDAYDRETEQQAKHEQEPDNYAYKYANPTVYRKQYLSLHKLTKQFRLTSSIVCFFDKELTLDNASIKPLVVSLRDRITETEAEEEMLKPNIWKATLREIFSYPPRIRLGNNVQFYWCFPICVTRIHQERYRWGEPDTVPGGFGNFTWKKFNGHERDIEIGDNCVITSCADWAVSKPLVNAEHVGRFIMKDNATFYVTTEGYSDMALDESLVAVDVLQDNTKGEHLSPKVEYIFEDGSKIYMRKGTNWNQDNTLSHIWRIKVRPNDSLVV